MRICKIRLLKLASILIRFEFVFLLTNLHAGAQQNCAWLFSSQNETPLYFSSTIFSPIINIEGLPQIADGKLLIEERDPVTNQSQKILRWEERHYSEDYIGFLPTPADFEMARLFHGFGGGNIAFAEGYARRGTPAEKEAILKRDQELLPFFIKSHRIGFAYVNSPHRKAGDPFSAYLRIFDGTDYVQLVGPKGRKSESPMQVPTEQSMEQAGVKTDYFKAYRYQKYQIFQIGKYVISKHLSPKEKTEARKQLMKWLYENYLDPKKFLTDKVIFVFNVDRPALIDTYFNEFGATLVDPLRFDPPIAKPNGMLEVDLKTLRFHVEKIINESD